MRISISGTAAASQPSPGTLNPPREHPLHNPALERIAERARQLLRAPAASIFLTPEGLRFFGGNANSAVLSMQTADLPTLDRVGSLVVASGDRKSVV